MNTLMNTRQKMNAIEAAKRNTSMAEYSMTTSIFSPFSDNPHGISWDKPGPFDLLSWGLLQTIHMYPPLIVGFSGMDSSHV